MLFAWFPAAAAVLAVIADLLAGDPPNALHPVGWMGRGINAFRRKSAVRRDGSRGGGNSDRRQFLQGLAFVAVGLTAAAAIAWVLARLLALLPAAAALVPAALLLKGSFAFRSLIRACASVEEALAGDDIDEARRLLSWHLVSRPVENLDSAHAASAVIESAAENFTDSVAAPLFWFSLLGLPGAWACRFADTADSILGYRDEEREWLGKAAARLDDILCWIPARLSGWVLAAAAAILPGLSGRRAAAAMRRDARHCSSPNSGWAMSAAAGALGVRLEKPGVYVLNDTGAEPVPGDIAGIRRLLGAGLLLWTLFTVLLCTVPGLFQAKGL